MHASVASVHLRPLDRQRRRHLGGPLLPPRPPKRAGAPETKRRRARQDGPVARHAGPTPRHLSATSGGERVETERGPGRPPLDEGQTPSESGLRREDAHGAGEIKRGRVGKWRPGGERNGAWGLGGCSERQRQRCHFRRVERGGQPRRGAPGRGPPERRQRAPPGNGTKKPPSPPRQKKMGGRGKGECRECSECEQLQKKTEGEQKRTSGRRQETEREKVRTCRWSMRRDATRLRREGPDGRPRLPERFARSAGCRAPDAGHEPATRRGRRGS